MSDQHPQKTEKKPEEEKASASEISSKALPNVEPHVYKPETPATTAPPEPSEINKETPSEPAQEQKSSSPEEDDITVNEPLFEPEKKSNKKLIIFASLVLLLVIAVLVLLFNYFTKSKKPQATESAPIQPETESTQAQEELKPEEKDFDRPQVALEILNGSGVAGAAKKLADKLGALGYSIIEVGNAQGKIDKTEILIAASLEDNKEKFLEDLGEEFKEATIAGSLEDSTASARITIGKD